MLHLPALQGRLLLLHEVLTAVLLHPRQDLLPAAIVLPDLQDLLPAAATVPQVLLPEAAAGAVLQDRAEDNNILS